VSLTPSPMPTNVASTQGTTRNKLNTRESSTGMPLGNSLWKKCCNWRIEAVHGESTLLLYVEPTPYRLGLIRRIAECSPLPLEVLFIAANVSQSWNLSLHGTSASYLPPGTLAASIEIAKRLSARRHCLTQIAGWGGRGVLISAWMLAWWYRVPLYVESDTQLPVGLPLWKRAIKRLVYPLLFKIPKKFYAAGSRQALYFRHYGVENDRIVIDRMTVDVVDIMRRSNALREQRTVSGVRREFGLSSEQTVFVYVGRLESYKGIESLLAAFDCLHRTHPQAALLIVGDGPERTRVESAAKDNQSIRYAGRLDYDQVVRAYNCGDAAVVPSQFEPWGLVVNEAMASGLPVIVSDRVGCVDDLIRHGETGLVYRAGSVDELSLCMGQLAQDSEGRRAMGAAGQRLISGWTLEQEARTIVAAWES
jgi:glycosyltransferase involved in cell wall biosynthesis